MMNRTISFLLPVILVSGALLTLLALGLPHLAHAADPSISPVIAGVDPTAVAAWIGAISGGVALILTIAFQALKVIAPHTKTPIDDEIRDGIGEILDHLRGQSTTTVVVAPPAPAPPRDPQAGRTSLGLLGIVSIGVLVGVAAEWMTLSGCATVDRAGDAAKVAVLDCAKPQLAPSAALIARWAIEDALAGKIDWAAHERDATGFGLGVGSCAYAEVLRAWKAKPTPQALATSAPPPDEGAAGLERLRERLGGGPIKLADGTVL